MNTYKESNLIKGWFVGNFNPTLFKTTDFEVGIKRYKAGEIDPPHYHKIATEITFVVKGLIEMNGTIFKTGDIIVLEPGEVSIFKALEDTNLSVVKIPSVLGDKYETHSS